MKKLIGLAVVLIAVAAMQAVNVYVENGNEYSGEIQSNDGKTLVLTDEEVTITIPLHVIKSVLDDGKDITKDVTGATVENTGVDEQFIGTSDYFVASQLLGSKESIVVKPARLENPSPDKLSGSQSFILYSTGDKFVTEYYYRTKIADSAKLRKGDVVIYFDRPEESICTAPQNAEETRSGTWRMAKVTDLSFSELGYVTVSGEIDVALDNLRTTIK